MMFGGDKAPQRYQGLPDPEENTVTVSGMEDFGALMFSLFRLTLVDEYDFEVRSLALAAPVDASRRVGLVRTCSCKGMATGMYVAVLNSSRVVLGVLQGMQAIDSLMATLLVTCWLTLSAVLMLNLLIALLSNTFQRYVSGLTYTFQRCGPVLTKPPRGAPLFSQAPSRGTPLFLLKPSRGTPLFSQAPSRGTPLL